MEPTERVRTVAELLRYLEKTVRAVQIYPPGNPHCQEFLSGLHELFTQCLAGIDPIVVRVSRTELHFEGERVYSNPERRENLAFVLYKDGLRDLAFHRGLELREVREFAQAFNRDFTVEYLDDDISTYLWERDLAHVSLRLSEDYLEEGLPPELRSAEDQRSAARELLHVGIFEPAQLRRAIAGSPEAGAAGVTMLEPALSPARVALSPEDAVRLRLLQQADASREFFEEMVEVVCSIFADQPGEQQRPYFNLFRSLLESLFTTGDLRRAAVLLRRLRRLASEPIPGARRVELFLDELGTGDLLSILGRSLERGVVQDERQLGELLALFPTSAIPGLTSLLGTLTSMKWRRLVCQVLARLGSADVTTLVPGLQDRRWFVVRNIAFTLGMIGSPQAVLHLGQLVDHGDARVRKEALRALGRIDDPEALRHVLLALSHPDASTRRQALRALPRQRHAAAAAELERLSREPSFARLDLREREEVARTLGRLAGDDLVAPLESRLRRGGWLGGRRRREDRHLAAVALVALASPAAQEALRRALPALAGPTRRLVEAVLETPGAGAEKPS